MKKNKITNKLLWEKASDIFAFIGNKMEKLIPTEELHQIHYDGKIFNDDSWSQVLICYTNSASFDEEQFAAVNHALRNINDEKLYYMALEATDKSDDYFFEELEFLWMEYHNLDTAHFFQNLIFSGSLKWGAILFYEDYGILGGEKELMDKFKESYPSWRQGKINFIELWEEAHSHSGVDINWMPGFLQQMD